MSRGDKQHPPKKKHATKLRKPAIVAMSEGERAVKARQEFEKALNHLHDAEELAVWGRVPNACVHSAYYAMHHCASAAILAAGGVGKYRDAPKSHEHVIEHFGKLVSGETGDLSQTGLALNRARNDRMIADYGLIQRVSGEDAKVAALEARKFVDACRAKWRLGGAGSA